MGDMLQWRSVVDGVLEAGLDELSLRLALFHPWELGFFSPERTGIELSFLTGGLYLARSFTVKTGIVGPYASRWSRLCWYLCHRGKFAFACLSGGGGAEDNLFVVSSLLLIQRGNSGRLA